MLTLVLRSWQESPYYGGDEWTRDVRDGAPPPEKWNHPKTFTVLPDRGVVLK